MSGEEKGMDTPDRRKNNQIAASVSKFEDSPVFSFINDLSPIKPLKCNHLSHMMIPLSFSSLPSVFTSPHVSSFRALQRHQLQDPSTPEFASDSGITVEGSQVNTAKELDEQEGTIKSSESDGELAVETSLHCLRFSGGEFPNSSPIHHEVVCESEVDKKGKSLADQNTHVMSYEWEDFNEALIFESPNDKASCNEKICPSNQNGVHGFQSFCEDVPNEQQHLSSQPGPGEGMQTAEAPEMEVDTSLNRFGEENLSGIYRGTRRRCLVFEVGCTLRKHMQQPSGSDSSLMLQSETSAFSNDQNLLHMKPGNSPSSHVLPAIGLHLNALATTPGVSLSHDLSTPGRLLIGPNSSVNFHFSPSSEVLLNNMLSASLDEEGENIIVPLEDPCQTSAHMEIEGMNHSSPKKKRRRAEASGNAEGCRRCNCKKSKCLKLYCECFAAGVYCVDQCACIDCFNKPVNEHKVLETRKQIESRNPLAFAPKVIRGTNPLAETGDDSTETPASARHKRGCNCKRSGCLKKYCECYQGGVGCSINCRCEGCKNAFGRKDGIEPEEIDEADRVNMTSMLDKNSHKILLENDSCIPATPVPVGRQLLQQQYSSKPKSARVASSFPCVGMMFDKQSFHPQPPAKFRHHLETVMEDHETPGFLQGISSSTNCVVKSSSPNGKRVSSPNIITGLRSSRKLILQSIPSFPSLTYDE